jgi:hypothetical protein
VDAFLMIVLSAVVALGMVALGRSAYQRYRIRRSGVLRTATITEVQLVPLLAEGATSMSWRARYRYVDDGDIPHEEWSPFLSYDPTLRSTGNRCEIRFDPRRPERSAWIEGS